jgi:hypothetical protein
MRGRCLLAALGRATAVIGRQARRAQGDRARYGPVERGDQDGHDASKDGAGHVRRALLITGPTASGKSAAALALAQRFGATIVNADSMQVYNDLRILTARPASDEERLAPHRLFGVVDGAVNYSVGRWSQAARDVLAEIGEEPVSAGRVGGLVHQPGKRRGQVHRSATGSR